MSDIPASPRFRPAARRQTRARTALCGRAELSTTAKPSSNTPNLATAQAIIRSRAPIFIRAPFTDLHFVIRSRSAAEAEVVQHPFGHMCRAEFVGSQEGLVPDAVTKVQDHLPRWASLALLHGRLGVVIADSRDPNAAHSPAAPIQIELGVFVYFPGLLSRGWPRRVGIDSKPQHQGENCWKEECGSTKYERRLTAAQAADQGMPSATGLPGGGQIAQTAFGADVAARVARSRGAYRAELPVGG
jgi:hypothetical protein